VEYLLMLLSAFGLGAAHALEPGHGKTIVAAYLVGSKGRTIDAILLGGIVTATHTGSVFVLALASTVAAAYFVPDQVQRWFGVVSGLLVVGVGGWMIYARTKYGPPVHSHSHEGHEHGAAAAHGHSHAVAEHTHAHDEHDHAPHAHPHAEEIPHAHPHPHPHPHAEETPRQGVNLGSLVALGVSGGIVPCPAALLLIPAAIGSGAIFKGLLLVVSFSLGLAVVLMAMGVVTLKAAGFASGWLERGDWTRRISIASAYFITLLGVALTVKAMLAPAMH
jgi:nickel/cobalt transporter (NicO) family protein